MANLKVAQEIEAGSLHDDLSNACSDLSASRSELRGIASLLQLVEEALTEESMERHAVGALCTALRREERNLGMIHEEIDTLVARAAKGGAS